MDVKSDVNKRRKILNKRKAALNTTFFIKKERSFAYKKISGILQKPLVDRSDDEIELLSKYEDIARQISYRIIQRQRIKERALEYEDEPDVFIEKCKTLAEALSNSNHLIVYTGAGISTAARIPDYRGTNGIWTLLQQGKDVGMHDLSRAEPTLTHMALYSLYRTGLLKHIVSQNCDGLHLRSGLPRTILSEVHGNMYIEACVKCKPHINYLRLFDVTEHTARFSHTTLRLCYKCGGPLKDTIVHFGERGKLQWPLNWEMACKQADMADVILCLGSSLKVLKKYPWLWCMDKRADKRPKLYIVNLQWTPKDNKSVLKINGKCDTVLEHVMSHLGLAIPKYMRNLDPIFHHATALNDLETHTTSQPCLELNISHISPPSSFDHFDMNNLSQSTLNTSVLYSNDNCTIINRSNKNNNNNNNCKINITAIDNSNENNCDDSNRTGTIVGDRRTSTVRNSDKSTVGSNNNNNKRRSRSCSSDNSNFSFSASSNSRSFRRTGSNSCSDSGCDEENTISSSFSDKSCSVDLDNDKYVETQIKPLAIVLDKCIVDEHESCLVKRRKTNEDQITGTRNCDKSVTDVEGNHLNNDSKPKRSKRHTHAAQTLYDIKDSLPGYMTRGNVRKYLDNQTTTSNVNEKSCFRSKISNNAYSSLREFPRARSRSRIRDNDKLIDDDLLNSKSKGNNDNNDQSICDSNSLADDTKNDITSSTNSVTIIDEEAYSTIDSSAFSGDNYNNDNSDRADWAQCESSATVNGPEDNSRSTISPAAERSNDTSSSVRSGEITITTIAAELSSVVRPMITLSDIGDNIFLVNGSILFPFSFDPTLFWNSYLNFLLYNANLFNNPTNNNTPSITIETPSPIVVDVRPPSSSESKQTDVVEQAATTSSVVNESERDHSETIVSTSDAEIKSEFPPDKSLLCEFCCNYYNSRSCMFYTKYTNDVNESSANCVCCIDDDDDDDDNVEEVAEDDEKPIVVKNQFVNPGWFGKGYRKRAGIGVKKRK